MALRRQHVPSSPNFLPKNGKTLYERLGACFAIAAVIESIQAMRLLLSDCRQDSAMLHFATGTGIAWSPAGLKSCALVWVAEVTGGPI